MNEPDRPIQGVHSPDPYVRVELESPPADENTPNGGPMADQHEQNEDLTTAIREAVTELLDEFGVRAWSLVAWTGTADKSAFHLASAQDGVYPEAWQTGQIGQINSLANNLVRLRMGGGG